VCLWWVSWICLASLLALDLRHALQRTWLQHGQRRRYGSVSNSCDYPMLLLTYCMPRWLYKEISLLVIMALKGKARGALGGCCKSSTFAVWRNENYTGSETTPYINQGKGDSLARRTVSPPPGRMKVRFQGCIRWTREKEELVRIWRMTSRPLLQTTTLRATKFWRACLVVVSLCAWSAEWACSFKLLVVACLQGYKNKASVK